MSFTAGAEIKGDSAWAEAPEHFFMEEIFQNEFARLFGMRTHEAFDYAIEHEPADGFWGRYVEALRDARHATRDILAQLHAEGGFPLLEFGLPASDEWVDEDDDYGWVDRKAAISGPFTERIDVGDLGYIGVKSDVLGEPLYLGGDDTWGEPSDFTPDMHDGE